jgi:TPR repeat protein
MLTIKFMFRLICLLAVLAFATSAVAVTDESPEELVQKTRRLSAEEVKKVMAEANAGNPRSQFWTGLIYDLGAHVTADHQSAALWYGKSAEQHYAPAQY